VLSLFSSVRGAAKRSHATCSALRALSRCVRSAGPAYNLGRRREHQCLGGDSKCNAGRSTMGVAGSPWPWCYNCWPVTTFSHLHQLSRYIQVLESRG